MGNVFNFVELVVGWNERIYSSSPKEPKFFRENVLASSCETHQTGLCLAHFALRCFEKPRGRLTFALQGCSTTRLLQHSPLVDDLAKSSFANVLPSDLKRKARKSESKLTTLSDRAVSARASCTVIKQRSNRRIRDWPGLDDLASATMYTEQDMCLTGCVVVC